MCSCGSAALVQPVSEPSVDALGRGAAIFNLRSCDVGHFVGNLAV